MPFVQLPENEIPQRVRFSGDAVLPRPRGLLLGCAVDVVISPMGSGFELPNPNVQTGCGCSSPLA